MHGCLGKALPDRSLFNMLDYIIQHKARIVQLFKDKSKQPKKKLKTVKATEPESDSSVVLVT